MDVYKLNQKVLDLNFCSYQLHLSSEHIQNTASRLQEMSIDLVSNYGLQMVLLSGIVIGLAYLYFNYSDYKAIQKQTQIESQQEEARLKTRRNEL